MYLFIAVTNDAGMNTLMAKLVLFLFFFFKGNHHINFKFIYLFIYGCVGSSLLCEGFL